VTETTVPTSQPPDEYDLPEDIATIKLNRLDASYAKQVKDSLNFNDRLQKSLFGQIISKIGDWSSNVLRKAFVHIGDAGQSRAFFVKFEGEGVDDHGGPYRAAFETAIGDEPENLLELLVPCSNAGENIGENRDQTILNPKYLKDSSKLPLYYHLGKLIGVACRHNILCSISLPRLIWRPIAGEILTPADLAATNLHVVQSLKNITRGDVKDDDVSDLLTQLLCDELSCGLSSMQVRKLLANVATNDSDVSPYKEFDGKNLTVDAMHKHRLVSLVEQLLIVSQVSGLQQLCSGLSAILPTELCSIFTSSELEVLFCGESEVDITLLQKVTEYDGVSPSDRYALVIYLGIIFLFFLIISCRHIQQFWEALYLMSPNDLSQFINFCSGRKRLPSSAADFPMTFKLTMPPPKSADHPDSYLPIAQTCFFSLSLPRYSSTAVILLLTLNFY
jgi:hypothetical protein